MAGSGMNSSGRNEKKDRRRVSDLTSGQKRQSPAPSYPSQQPDRSEAKSGESTSADPNLAEGTRPSIRYSDGSRVARIDAVNEPSPSKIERQSTERVIRSVPKFPMGSAFNRTEYQRSLSEWLFQPASAWSNRSQIQLYIGKQVLHRSKAMDEPNFMRVSKHDLESMAELYDQHFFQGLCLPLAKSYGLSFRLSSRMSRAGGKTTRTILRGTRSQPQRTHYEIALSTSLLFQSFRNPEDTIRVCGYDCPDRLTAMQRVVEHEMVHLCEMLAWIHSDCMANRFQSIAKNMFGHTEHKHELVTQQERAAKEFNIRAGSRVVFEFENKRLTGIVNRITRRATILVEDPRGARYTNGRYYLKYYVPIHQLRPIQ
jgi:hypothetical protein